MTAFILRRLLQSLIVLLAMIVIVFFGVHVVGDPIWLLVSPDLTQDQIAEVARQLGLDRPIWEQFLVFLGNALQGDLGRSFVHGQPAMKLILERLPATMELALFALFLALVIGLPLGLYAGLRPERASSRAIMAASILGFSLPTFWVGLMLIMVFAVILGWLPSTGRGPTIAFLGIETSLLSLKGLSHALLPAINLALLKVSLVIRLTRAGVREVLPLDFIKFARAKGLSETRIVLVHLLRNILIPVVTVIGLEFGSLVAFSVVTESIFAWPGMGKLLLDSIQRVDRPVIVAYVMLIVVLFVVINLIVDLLYCLLDPRVRLQDQAS
ncbi:ABC transporter permease [Candidatus Raskinella chloraquaticus]|uniref:ABC transporter permease n=1 Tax=Candidatus Raskinella chloraquaticus TaxID=1951219 RepID=A0A1W9HZ62_9HYPH|nr:MAG: ABC transporter permease [Proteobacteria bacterium SG_bin8]